MITDTPTLLKRKAQPLTLTEVIGWLFVFGLVLFAVFWQLTAIPIRQWDEARLAVNAAEMLENGNFLVTHYDGGPDMWNTKPPLQIWLLALSLKIFGYTEFAIRFPTVLAVLATFGTLLWFGIKVLKNKLVAALAVLVLVSSRGYMGYHVARNGDYDALLVFFITLYLLSFFYYLENFRARYFWIFIAGLTLAVLTKGVAALMPGPALLLYLLFSRKTIPFFSQKRVYTGALLFILIIGGYYGAREALNPGYLNAVHINELGGRFLEVVESHRHSWDWYLELMQREKFVFWFYLLPVCFWVLLWQTKGPEKRFAVLGTTFVIAFMVIISVAQTKLFWYDAPVYPIAALLLALGCSRLLQFFKAENEVKKHWIYIAGSIALLIWWPYNNVLSGYLQEKSSAPNWGSETFFGPVMKELAKKHPEYKNVVFLLPTGQYNASARFYKLAYTQAGYNVEERNQQEFSEFKPGEIVVLCNEELRNQLDVAFAVETLYAYHAARAYRIIAKK